MKKALVTGAGGFIGGHLVHYLKAHDYWVRGVDIKLPEFDTSSADDFVLADLRDPGELNAVFNADTFDEVYGLAADMGGMGFISFHHADILYNNLMINFNTIHAAMQAQVGRYFFSSSACIYPEYRQRETDSPPLKEKDAFPAQPQDAYGWEKLTTEQYLLHLQTEGKLNVRIARFHNSYGIRGAWTGGREKAPAALCRKVVEAKLGLSKHGWLDDQRGRRNPVIEIWGDGQQARSYMYIDDCVEGIYRLMQSDYSQPVNIGSNEQVSVNELLQAICDAAGQQVTPRYINGPTGVRGRNSDNALCQRVLDWQPGIKLTDGIAFTYRWIEEQVKEAQK